VAPKPMLKTYDDETEQAPAGDIVIDPFLGSRSRLIGCEVILRRYEAVTGQAAVLEGTGETYAELAARRQHEAEHRAHLTPTKALVSALHKCKNGRRLLVRSASAVGAGHSVALT
jgi:hypothetical protein